VRAARLPQSCAVFCAVFRVATPLATGERLGHFTSENNDLANQMPTNYHARNPRGQQRDKLFREALRMELAAAGDDLQKLREIARGLIEKAAAGDLQAIKELADRLDGKPAQMLLEPSDGEPIGRISRIVHEIVHVTKTQEEIENEDLVVDYREIKSVNGGNGDNGHAK
jgi:hypothetical protein